MNKPILNVITRFSRKEGFKRALHSLNEQLYDNINHFITYETDEALEFLKSFNYRFPTKFIRVPKCNKIQDLKIYYEHHDGDTDYLNWDWEKWDTKVTLGQSPPPRNPVQCEAKRYTKDGWWCESLSTSVRRESGHAPYNFYLKIAEQHVNEGWIIYLCDDDIFTSNQSLQTLSYSILEHNEDTLHIFKIFRDNHLEGTIPSSHYLQYHKAGHPLILGEVAGGGISFHSKYKEYTQWSWWTADDYRTARVLTEKIPNINFIDKILYDASHEGLGRAHIELPKLK